MWSVVSTLTTGITATFYFSYKVGQFIVTSLALIVSQGVHLTGIIYDLLTVIFEDFSVFSRDVTQRIRYVVKGIAYLGDCVISSGVLTFQALQNVYQFISFLLWTTVTAVAEGVSATITGVKETSLFIRQVIVLFGDGVWFIVIFIPKTILSLGPLSLYYLGKLFIRIYNSATRKILCVYTTVLDCLYDCYLFVTDVPVESLIGLITAFCLLYIFIQFYKVILLYARIRLALLKITVRLKYVKCKHTLNRCVSRYIRYVRLRRVPDSKPVNHNNSSKFSDDIFCIICQDSLRCILLLPCKHLCLCRNCAGRMLRHSRRCPMCRCDIQQVMKVYT